MAVLFQLSVFQLSAFSQIPCQYDVEIIQAPECPFGIQRPTVALGISPNGKYVVGRYGQCDKAFNDEAFCYDTETKQFMTLPRPAGTSEALAADVNDAGWIVGTYGLEQGGNRGFVYKLNENKWIEFPPIGKTGGSSASAIINAGQVCGSRSLKGAKSNGSPFNSFIWSEAEGFTDLGVMNGPNSWARGISENGTVVGSTGNVASENTRAFIHENGKTKVFDPVPGGFTSGAVAIGNSGQALIAGRVGKPDKWIGRTFRYQNGEWSVLQPLQEEESSVCSALTNDDVAVGSSRKHSEGGPIEQAVVWIGSLAVDLRDLAAKKGSVELGGATDASNTGLIITLGLDSQNDVISTILTPRPILVGDLNCNDLVNVDDLILLIGDWGPCDGCRSDFDRNETVNVIDLFVVLDNWTY